MWSTCGNRGETLYLSSTYLANYTTSNLGERKKTENKGKNSVSIPVRVDLCLNIPTRAERALLQYLGRQEQPFFVL